MLNLHSFIFTLMLCYVMLCYYNFYLEFFIFESSSSNINLRVQTQCSYLLIMVTTQEKFTPLTV